MTNHPFLKRIRIEREVIQTANQKYELFGTKLNGLSEATINKWYDITVLTYNKNNGILAQIKANLLLIGRLVKAESGCSHRGAMIATLPSFDLVTFELQNLKDLISKA